MRHKKSINHLGRNTAHRKAMLSNMAASLIMHKRINTTTAKAKALKRFIEPLITRSKDDSTHSRRVAFSVLQDKEAVAELFREIGPKVADRPGGYTRIIKLGARLGDNAEMAMMELVDYNENLLSEKASEKKASRKRRGGKKKTDEVIAEAKKVAPEITEAEVVESTITEEVVEDAVAEEVKSEDAVVEEVKSEDAVVEEVKSEEPVAAVESIEEPLAAEAAPAEAEEEVEAPEKEDNEENDSEKKES